MSRSASSPAFNENLHRVDEQADKAADQGAVDADILEVAPDRAFEPVRDRAGVPAAHRLGDQLDDAVAIRGDEADRGAARELVDRRLEAGLGLQRLAELAQRLAELAGERRVGIARTLEQPGAALSQTPPSQAEPASFSITSPFHASTRAIVSGSC